MTNTEFKKDDFFKECCKQAHTPATTRQASKFQMKKGLAYSKRSVAKIAIKKKENENS